MSDRFFVFQDSLSIIEVEVSRILAGVEPDLAVSIATIRQAADDLHRVAGSDTACPAVTYINGQLVPEYRGPSPSDRLGVSMTAGLL